MKQSLIVLFFCLITTSQSAMCYAQSPKLDTLVSIGTYKLHFTILQGKGIPILFESGNGSDATVWNNLLPALYDSLGATLITYDRAGLGLSGIDTNHIDLPNEVGGLEKALKKLGYSNAIFLVSHSFGSYYSTIFARNNSKKVRGSVFIDPALPCNYTKQRNKEGNASITPELWERIRKEAIGLYFVLKNYETICDLMEKTSFPSAVPATVIAAEKQPFLKTDAYKEEWRECVKNFGTLPQHSYVFAQNCGHTVWNDNPQLVINEIVKLYRQTTTAQVKQSVKKY